MYPTQKSIVLLSLLTLGVGLSCSAPISLVQRVYKSVAPVDYTESDIPTQIAVKASLTASATPVTLTETATPTKTAKPASPTRNATPRATLAQRPLTSTPVPDEVSVFCKDKKPYNLLFISRNASYELLGKNVETRPNGLQVLYVINKDGTHGARVWCLDNGFTDNGRKIVACTGVATMYYEVSVCDPTRSGCVTNKLEIIRCTAECDTIIKKETCERNAIACVWREREGVCLER